MTNPLRKALILPLIALTAFVLPLAPVSSGAAPSPKPVASVSQRWICVKRVCHHKGWWIAAAKYARAVEKHKRHEALVAWLAALAAHSFPPADLAPVINCIYSHESGNYAESSHPSAGSGAAQWVPSTWRYWSAKAGYPGYSYAFLAPVKAQQDTLVFTLRNGGAHNWDPAFGDDPCTVGMA